MYFIVFWAIYHAWRHDITDITSHDTTDDLFHEVRLAITVVKRVNCLSVCDRVAIVCEVDENKEVTLQLMLGHILIK